MSALPHVIWDMGGILYRYFTEMMLDVATERGWPLEELPLGPTGPLPDPDYQRLLAGEFDEPEYLVLIKTRLTNLGIDFEPTSELASYWQMRPETRDAIMAIGDSGHRQAVLTNDASKWLGDNWWETWEASEWFGAVVDVAQIGVRKPEPEPYLAVTAALGVPPEECLFIDDLPSNCRGAEEVGMTSHLFDIANPRGSLDSLLKRLGL
jgi:FMN phosphatase YigB (HAD superfamily)